jgi:hypothetical protein
MRGLFLAIALLGSLAASACERMAIRQQPSGTSDSAPRGARPTRSLVIWRVGSPATPFARLPQVVPPAAFERQAKALGMRIESPGLTGIGVRQAFLRARAQHREPDVLVFSNIGIIRGLPPIAGRGRLIGLDEEPSIAGSLIKVSESFDALAPRTLKYLVSTSPNHADARALAIRTIDCSSADADNKNVRVSGTHGTSLTDAADRSARAYLNQDYGALASLSGGRYPDGALPVERTERVLGTTILPVRRALGESRVCSSWGNGRFVLATIVTAFQSEAEVGYRR